MRHSSRIAGASMLGVACLLATLSLAPLTASAKGVARAGVLDNCNWNRPGVDPFMGDVVAAVDRYTDIAPPVREQLKERMRARQYDEIVVISRDAIRGKGNYNTRISDMHFGPGRVCRNVTRAGWSEQMQERGLVYCVQGQCILVPTICRNVSRITQAPASAPPAAGAAPGGAAPVAAAPAAPEAAGVPLIDNPDALRGGSFTGGAMPPEVASIPFLPFNNYVRTVGGITPPAGMGGGGGGGGGGGLPPDQGSSIIVPPTVIIPTFPPTVPTVLPAVPEPQTWAMLLAGLTLVGYSALRRRTVRAA
ncbi:MHFG family PEP-CTERM protein [Janthinobacterium lividum]